MNTFTSLMSLLKESYGEPLKIHEKSGKEPKFANLKNKLKKSK